MHKLGIGIGLLFFAMASLALGEQTSVPDHETLGVGVYDSRAVAVAFVGTTAFNAWMGELQDEMDKAKSEGDKKKIKELKAEGKARQNQLHKQGFSTAPVDDLLIHIQDKLPEILKAANVEVLVSKWDEAALANYASSEHVDVTMVLVDAFQPNERQRQSAVEIQKHSPISLEQAEKMDD